MGSDITNLIGEDKTIEIIESTQIINTDFFNELNDIIMKDEELSSRIYTLQMMNFDSEPDKPLNNSSGICRLLIILYFVYIIRYVITNFFGNIFEYRFLLDKFFGILWFKNWILAGICYFLYDFFDCDH
jgi:hypothetical protein